jgi:hypothetical protein
MIWRRRSRPQYGPEEDPVNRLLVFLLFAFPAVWVAQTQTIPSPSVYIAPMGGYEAYLAAAFTKEHLPLAVVADKNKAEYVITSTVAQSDLVGNPVTSTSIAVIDLRASRIVFACGASTNQVQKAAENCASQLKKVIKKPRK